VEAQELSDAIVNEAHSNRRHDALTASALVTRNCPNITVINSRKGCCFLCLTGGHEVNQCHNSAQNVIGNIINQFLILHLPILMHHHK